MFQSGYVNRFKKKEISKLKREFDKLEKNLGGIRDMDGMPDVMFVIDIKREFNAIAEAKHLGIPIVAIVDTNCDPEVVDFPIPGNDDAIRACQLIANKIGAAIMEGRQLREDELVQEINEAATAEDGDDIPVEEIVKADESTESAETK